MRSRANASTAKQGEAAREEQNGVADISAMDNNRPKDASKSLARPFVSRLQLRAAALNTRTGTSFLFYIAGTALILAFKVALTTFFLHFGFIIWVAYLITHILVFLASLMYHARISFKTKLTWTTAYRYFFAVVSVKLIDYLMVVCSVHIHILKATPAIIASTFILYAFRYFAARRAFGRNNSKIVSYSE